MINENKELCELEKSEQWEVLKDKIPYFELKDKLNRKEFKNLIYTTNGANVVLNDLINEFVCYSYEYNKIKKENDYLKREVKRLKKYEVFDSLEPKKKIKVSKQELEEIKELRLKGKSVKDIASIYNVSRQTIYNYFQKFEF